MNTFFKGILGLAMMLGVSSSFALAKDNGTINFKGTVVGGACSVAVKHAGKNNLVDFGNLSQKSFSAVGDELRYNLIERPRIVFSGCEGVKELKLTVNGPGNSDTGFDLRADRPVGEKRIYMRLAFRPDNGGGALNPGKASSILNNFEGPLTDPNGHNLGTELVVESTGTIPSGEFGALLTFELKYS